MKTAAVMPAYNEETRLANVVRAVLEARLVDEVIVVNDGSTDRTSQVARSIAGVRVVDLVKNVGKGGAMTAGVDATDAEVVVFLDADLIGLTSAHVDSLLEPVVNGTVQMAVGRFRGGRRLTDWSQKLVPNVSGQRAIVREIFEQIPDLETTRYGVEMAITRFCHHFRIVTSGVLLAGVTHPMKEEKLGFLRGAACRARMYTQIVKIIMDPREPRKRTPRRKRFLKRLTDAARDPRRIGPAGGERGGPNSTKRRRRTALRAPRDR